LLAGCGQPPIGAPLSSSATRPTTERTHASGTYSVLYNFTGSADGADPNGGLLNIDDTLYGTTWDGGRQRCVRHRAKLFCGTVFAITTSGAETQLYRFKGQRKDGLSPNGGLIDVNGTLYGTTTGGGTYGDGTVYSITPSGVETVLHSFGGSGDGMKPAAGLVGLSGTLYGTTELGGTYGDGTVYSITPSGVETVLHSFDQQSGDGTSPVAGLIHVDGTLYGTTPGGGANNDGTVFEITPSGKENILHDFGGAGDGKTPYGGLVYVDGRLYGTTYLGGKWAVKGSSGGGTVFVTTTSGKETVLYSFRGRNKGAENPYGTLSEMDGTLYGVSGGGACKGCTHGTVFAITKSGSEKLVYSFGANGGWSPSGQLTDVNGTLYGTTEHGGTGASCSGGCGAVFALTP
jgi:uncharacterized repeat protein (TIGR03803 family)